MPLERALIRMQTSGEEEHQGIFGSLRTVLNESNGNIISLYKGWHAYIVLAMKPALENTIFDTLKKWRLLSRRGSGGRALLSSVEAFVLGLLARAVCTVLTFPATRGLRIQQGRRKKKMMTKENKVKKVKEEKEEVKEEEKEEEEGRRKGI